MYGKRPGERERWGGGGGRSRTGDVKLCCCPTYLDGCFGMDNSMLHFLSPLGYQLFTAVMFATKAELTDSTTACTRRNDGEADCAVGRMRCVLVFKEIAELENEEQEEKTRLDEIPLPPKKPRCSYTTTFVHNIWCMGRILHFVHHESPQVNGRAISKGSEMN